MQPQRIQRKRVKGFNLQQESMKLNGLPAKSCTRPHKFGNPLKLVGDQIFIDASYRRKILSKWVLYGPGDIDDVLFLFAKLFDGTKFNDPDLQHWADYFAELDLNELNGYNLACFCGLNSKCHVDVLLRLIK